MGWGDGEINILQCFVLVFFPHFALPKKVVCYSRSKLVPEN